MSVQNLSENQNIDIKNKDSNFIDSDIMPLDSREGHENDKADTMPTGYSCQSTNMTRGNDTTPLDSREGHKHDNIESSFLSYSGLTRISRAKTTFMPQAFRITETGRSMVEMLGTLAIMGVLSIGGIMGYSYAMDRWRANQTMRDINLRSVDVLTQYENTGDANLDAWVNDKTIYPISLEDETIGIQVDEVPERVCEMMADGMADAVFAIKLNGAFIEEVPVECEPENTMVFYFTGDEEDEDTNTDKGDNTLIPCPEEFPTDVLLFTCEYEGMPIVCIAGQCGIDATVFCEMERITDCPVDKGCTILMDEETPPIPIVGQECQKDGASGRCDTNGKCILETNDEPVICGGVNCVEYIEEYFSTIPEDERVLMGMVISAPPKECITCVNDMCSVGQEVGQASLCAVDGFKACMDAGENLLICLAPQLCTGSADCGACHECIDGACQPVGGGSCTTADGEQGICSDFSSCFSCSAEGRVSVGTDAPCEEVCPNRYKDGSYCYPKCGEGIYADKPLRDTSGNCYACSEVGRVLVKDNPCEEVCSERYKYGNYCYYCPPEKPLMDTNGNCYACDDASDVQIRVLLSSIYLPCEGICPDRQQSGSYCYYCPPDKPLVDSNGGCHACSEEEDIAQGPYPNLLCSEVCPNRVKPNYFCKLK